MSLFVHVPNVDEW